MYSVIFCNVVNKSVRKKYVKVSPLGVQQPGSLLKNVTMVLLQ